MARIVVTTNDGRITLYEESGITMQQLDDLETASEVLEKITCAIDRADRKTRPYTAVFD